MWKRSPAVRCHAIKGGLRSYLGWWCIATEVPLRALSPSMSLHLMKNLTEMANSLDQRFGETLLTVREDVESSKERSRAYQLEFGSNVHMMDTSFLKFSSCFQLVKMNR